MKMLKTRLADYRKSAGITQIELADAVDVRRETIARLERGLYNPSLKLAYEIASFFGVSIEAIFSYVDIDDQTDGGF